MTNCSPRTSLDLYGTERIGKPKTNPTSSTLNVKFPIMGPLNSTLLMSKNTLKKQNKPELQKNKFKVNNKQEYANSPCGNEAICNNDEMKLSTMKTQVWLNKLPHNTDVSILIIVYFKDFQLCPT